MNLPPEPGLRRRLTYGNIVNRRNILNTHLSITGTRYLYNDFLNYDNLNSQFEQDNYNYVKQGLLLCDLIKISEILKNDKHINFDYCSICLDNNNENMILRKLVCNHIFHINCIEKWLSENTNCPMCRYELKIYNENE